jgi:threonine/homoserine/homoserine lactone efflux protein
MSLEAWLAFVAATAILVVIPGPTILTVISYSMAHGKCARLPLIAAVTLGDSTALVLSLLGLGTLLAASAMGFTVVKVAGGLYLLFLGIKMFRAGVSPVEVMTPAVPGSLWRLFGNTWLVTALNPKGIVFFVAFLPQFINRQADVPHQLWVLAITFVVMATINATLYAVFAAKAASFLQTRRAKQGFNIAGGSLLSIAGAWALLAKRAAG